MAEQECSFSSKAQLVPTDLSAILFVAQAGEERYERKKVGYGERVVYPLPHFSLHDSGHSPTVQPEGSLPPSQTN